jgi:hypothetical protein
MRYIKRDVTFYYRGQIERWDKRSRSCKWVSGYSENAYRDGKTYIMYPWMTKEECRKDVERWGFKAVFNEGNEK